VKILNWFFQLPVQASELLFLSASQSGTFLIAAILVGESGLLFIKLAIEAESRGFLLLLQMSAMSDLVRVH
jgi:hypothetical protein